MKRSEIITLIIAAYGAVLSTIAILRQFFSDRTKVRVTVRRNMQIVGDPRYRGVTLTIVRATNVGRRPVTITSLGASGLYPNLSFAITDTIPQLPCEITQGKYIMAHLPQAGINFSTIDFWEAGDSHGRVHKLQEASRFKHWKSMILLKRSFRKTSAAGKTTVK